MSTLSKLIHRFIRHTRVFSIRYALIEVLVVLDRIRWKNIPYAKMSHFLLNQKSKFILCWCRQYFSEEIAKYQNYSAERATNSTQKIWVCWLQGISNAPEVVRLCTKSITKHSNQREVILLDWSNIPQYCALPKYILDKYKNGIISAQQFTDILRVNILEKYGGLWVDATVLVTKEIPETVFKLPVFNVKGINPNFKHAYAVIDSTQYQSYLIASCPHSVTYSFLNECISKYWKEHDTLIDYFLLFYIAKIAREEIPGAMSEFNKVPNNNELCEVLGDACAKGIPFRRTALDFFAKNSTWAYKLSWKDQYPAKTRDGTPTVWGYIIDQDYNKKHEENFVY